MTELKERPLLLTVKQAGELCGFSRATSYVMANTEWAPFALRLSERVIRIPYDDLMGWIECKKEKAAEEPGCTD